MYTRGAGIFEPQVMTFFSHQGCFVSSFTRVLTVDFCFVATVCNIVMHGSGEISAVSENRVMFIIVCCCKLQYLLAEKYMLNHTFTVCNGVEQWQTQNTDVLRSVML